MLLSDKLLDRDDRIFNIRTTYCPMFVGKAVEIPETAIEVIDPEPEPEPVSPEVEEMLVADQTAMIALTTSRQGSRKPSRKNKKPKRNRLRGCFSVLGVLVLVALITVGGILGWQYVQGELSNGISLPSSSTVYEVGEWHKDGDLWIRLAEYEVSRDYIRLDFEIWNQTNQDIYFSWAPEQNFSMVDNKNNRYDVFEAGSRKQTVEKAERLVFTGYGYSTVDFDDDPLYNPGVTDLYVSMEYLSEFKKVTFHISVSK